MSDLLTDAPHLAARLAAFVASETSGDFDRLARDVFTYQSNHDEAYHRFCRGRGVTPDTIKTWRDIPPAPAAAFKRFSLSASEPTLCEPEQGGRVFHSSGTTSTETSRHFLDASALNVYRAALADGFRRFVLTDAARLPILALMPPPADLPHSSLSFMLDVLIREYGGNFFAGETWQDRLAQTLRTLDGPVVLFGTAFAWVHFFDASDEAFSLPNGSRLVETGGFKGRSREIERDELYRLLSERLHVPATHVLAEYGMSEMASQFYDSSLYDSVHGLRRTPRKIAPHYLRTRLIDPLTGRDAAPGETGLLAHYDLCNLNSVIAIQTEDMGSIADDGDGFHLLGRAPGAVLRGCSLTSEELQHAFGNPPGGEP